MTSWLRRGGATAEITEELEELLTGEEEIDAKEALRLAYLAREALLGGLGVGGALATRHSCVREDLGGSIGVVHIACGESHAVVFANTAVIVGGRTRLFIGDDAQALPSLFAPGEGEVHAMWGFGEDGLGRNAVVVTPTATAVITRESTFVVRLGGEVEEHGPVLGNALRSLLLP